MSMKYSPVLLVCRILLACGVFALVALMGLQPRTASAASPAFILSRHRHKVCRECPKLAATPIQVLYWGTRNH